jgi:hypothetical protein
MIRSNKKGWPDHTAQYIYPGPEGDIKGLFEPFEKSELDCNCKYYYYPFIAPILIIDIPCCLVVDTIFLPYDIYKVSVKKESRYMKRNSNE